MSTEITITSTTIDINVTESPITIEAPSGAYPLPTSVYSVFGRTGNVVAAEGDYTLTQLAGVTITSPVSGQALVYNGTSWVNNTETFVGTVTSVAALTLGTTGTDLTSTVANSTTTPVITLNVPTASASNRGALSSADWSIFNAKQPALSGTGFVKISGTTISYDNSTYYLASNPTAYIPLTALSSTATGLTYTNTTGVFSTTAGYGIPTTASQTTWDAAYNDKINSAAVTGTTTKTLTLNQQDGGTITASWTDDNTDAVTSVFGRTGAVVATSGDYNTLQVTENTNLYFTDQRARYAVSGDTASGVVYSNATGIIALDDIPNTSLINSSVTVNGSTVALGGTTSFTTTAVTEGTNLYYTDTRARAAITGTAPISVSSGVVSISQSGPSTNGYLSSADWNTFNGKQSALTLGNLTSSDITVTGGTGAIIGAGSTLTLATVNTNVGAYGDSTNVPTITVNAKGLVTAASQTAIPTATSSVTGLLTSTDWSTFNSKQAQLNGTGFVKASGTTITYDNSTYLTTISGIAAGGELSGTYASPSLVNSAVTGKVLTGVNITGGTVVDTDSILTAFGKVQNQINGLIGGSIYKGTWNASTNTPTLTSSVGTAGNYYIVSVAGTTNLNGITDWQIGDWVIYQGSEWEKVDNTDAVVSVNGFTGAVSLTTTDINEGTNLYYTDVRARTSLSASTGISYNSTTGVITNSLPDQTVTLTGAGTTSISGAYPSFTITSNDTYNGTVTSVAVTESGNALTITGSPVTTSGTINIGFAGAASQYVAGDGSLITFPSIISQAQNLITEVYNSTGATLTKGTIVYVNGGQGNLPTVTKALATSDTTSAQTYGIVQTSITNNNNGYVIAFGSLGDLDTQAYAAGTQLYLSGTTAGEWTSTKPYAPIHLVYVAVVTRSHPTQGVVEIRIQNGYEMDELHDVSAQSPTNGDILQYVAATDLWTKTAGTTSAIAEGSNLYYTDTRARNAVSLTTTGNSGASTYNNTTGVLNVPTYTLAGLGGINLTSISATSPLLYDNTTGVFSIQQSSGSQAGYLSSADWTTFNGKESVLTFSSPLVRTTNTISIPAATTSVNGYLTSTDWTTFNNKQNALTNPITGTGTTNYHTKFTGASTIGNSLIWDNGTNVGIGNQGTTYTLDVSGTLRNTTSAYFATTSGSVGIGNVTLASWYTGYTAMQLGASASIYGNKTTADTNTTQLANNAYLNTAATNWQYINADEATRYEQVNGEHNFYSVVSGSAGGNITWGTSKMTIASTGAATFTSAAGITNGNGLNLRAGGNTASDANVLNFTSLAGTINVSMFSDASSSNTRLKSLGNLSFHTGNIAISADNERVTILSTGNLGIGTSSPQSLLQVGAFSGNNAITIGGATDGVSSLYFGDGTGAALYRGFIEYQHSGDYMRFGTSATEQMRITSGGQIQETTSIADWSHTITNSSSTSPNGLFINYSNANMNNSSNQFIYCTDNFGASLRFAVYSNGNVVNQNNSYGSTSDIKLKENITDATPKLQDLLKVKVKNYNFIGDDKKQIGVVAQELEEIFPSMIEESNDIIKDENGENIETGEKTKSVKYSVFVPMLIKAMQEQQAIITSLQDRLDKAGL